MPIREIVLSTLLEKATIEIGILYTAPYKKKKKGKKNMNKYIQILKNLNKESKHLYC